MDRVQKAKVNVFFAISTQLIIFVLSFFVRKAFSTGLGVNYLGYESLFNNIVSVMSVADLGIIECMYFFLYRPFSENDREKMAMYVKLFKTIFFVIGVVLLIISILILPFIQYLIKGFEGNLLELRLSFMLYSLMSFSTYFFAEYRALIFVGQDDYAISVVNMATRVSSKLVQLIVIFKFQSFLIYVLTEAIFTIISNYVMKYIAYKKYSDVLKQYKVNSNFKNEFSVVLSKTKNSFINRMCVISVSSTDNILFSLLFGSRILGVLSNYTMISSALIAISLKIFNGMTASIGNLFNTNTNIDDNINKYNQLLKLSICLSLICFTGFLLFSDLLINNFFGYEYSVNSSTLVILSLFLYITVITMLPLMYINIKGYYKETRLPYIIWSISNLFISIVISILIDYKGIYIGTIISSLLFIILIHRFISKDAARHDCNKTIKNNWAFQIAAIILISSVYLISKSLFINCSLIHILIINSIEFMTVISFTIIMMLKLFPDFKLIAKKIVIKKASK